MNDASPNEQTGIDCRRDRKRRPLLAIMIVLLLGSSGIWIASRSERPAVEALALPADWPASKPSVIQRVEAKLPASYWRAKYAILGKPTSLALRSTLFELNESSMSRLTALLPRDVKLISTNRLRVWQLNEADLAQLIERLGATDGVRKLASPRVTTAHKVSSTVSTTVSIPAGNSAVNAGVEASFLPRVLHETIDLTVLLKHTEAITNLTRLDETQSTTKTLSQTNVAVSARVQLPSQGGILLLNDNVETVDGGKLFLLISGSVAKDKK